MTRTSTVGAGLGNKTSFGELPLLETIAPQALVQHGYRECTQRTYFLRLHRDSKDVKPFTPFDKIQAAKEFLETGRIDIARIAPKMLMKRIALLKKAMRLIKCRPDAKPAAFKALDCAFTYSGLNELGLQTDLLKVFRLKSKAFYEGAFIRAQQHLSDTDASAPTGWASAYQEQEKKAVDIVLIAHFEAKDSAPSPIQPDQALVQAFEMALLRVFFGLDATQTMTVLSSPNCIDPANGWVEESVPIDFKGSVYFGYKDGITAPKFSSEGQALDDTRNCTQHALGEILLGFPRNGKDNPYGELPLYPTAKPIDATDTGALNEKELFNLDFFRGSSFGVLRRMRQDIEAFDKWVKAQAAKNATPLADNPAWELWIKAKLLGRTAKSPYLTIATGSLMTSDIDPKFLNAYPALEPVPKLQDLGNEAGFQASDPKDEAGLGCPFGSHIRRMNPRDDFVVPFIARPLLRRGMPYQTKGAQGEKEVGLSGLFLCADITEQFEHLVGKWANGRVLGVEADPNNRDPLIGNHQAGDSPFLIRRTSDQADDLKLDNPAAPFVVTRGTLYTWFPNEAVLRTLNQYCGS